MSEIISKSGGEIIVHTPPRNIAVAPEVSTEADRVLGEFKLPGETDPFFRVERTLSGDTTPHQLRDKGIDCVITRSTPVINRAMMREGLLSVIGGACKNPGVDTMDHARHYGVEVLRSDANRYAVARYVIAMIDAFYNRILQCSAASWNEAGDWEKATMGPKRTTIRGKKLLVVGAGDIGLLVAQFAAEQLKMEVILFNDQPPVTRAHDIKIRAVAEDRGYQLARSLEEGFKSATVATLHMSDWDSSGNRNTANGCIPIELLKELGPDGLVINAARYGLISCDGRVARGYEIVDLVRNGELGGVAIDVHPKHMEKETAFRKYKHDEYGKLPYGAFITHHFAGSDDECIDTSGREIGSSIKRFARTGMNEGNSNLYPRDDGNINSITPGSLLIELTTTTTDGVVRRLHDLDLNLSGEGNNGQLGWSQIFERRLPDKFPGNPDRRRPVVSHVLAFEPRDGEPYLVEMRELVERLTTMNDTSIPENKKSQGGVDDDQWVHAIRVHATTDEQLKQLTDPNLRFAPNITEI